MAAASAYIPSGSPSCLLPHQEALQDQQVGLTRLLSNYCLYEHSENINKELENIKKNQTELKNIITKI